MFDIGSTVDKVYRINCIRCLVKTRHRVLASVKEPDDIFEDERLFELYEIVRCEGCYSVSFRREISNVGKFKPDGKIDEIDDAIDYFPIRRSGKRQIKSPYLPPLVRTVYREAWIALSNDQRVLASVGIRTLIEALCKEKSASGTNLEAKIDDLVTKGTMTIDGSRILHRLRIMGNKAAHEIAPQSQATLEAAMDVVENLLTNVYILPMRAKILDGPAS